MAHRLLRILNFHKDIPVKIDERIDLSQAFIAATYRQLAIASNCLLTIYDLSSILLDEDFSNVYDVIVTPHPILALTSTIDQIIYVYYDEQLKICSIPGREQSISIESFEEKKKKVHLCAIDDGNVLIGYESKIYSLTDFQWTFDSEIVNLCAGKEHILVLLADGRLFTWGNGLHGALGLGDLEPCTQPTHIEALGNDVVQIAAGGWHSLGKMRRKNLHRNSMDCLALLSDGSVMSWGWNNDGSLGLHSDDDDDNSGVFCDPTLVTCIPLGVDGKAISAGARHSALIGSNDQIWLFGSNKYGQLGNKSPFSIEKNMSVCCSSWFTFLY